MRKLQSEQSGGLPARWRRNRLLAGGITIVLAVIVLFPMRTFSRADGMDAWWLGARFAFREKVQGERKPDSDIVLVVFDDKCLDNWHEPDIAWNPHIARTLDVLHASGVRAIGIDRIQPESTEQWLKSAHNDEVLLKSLSQTDNIVWAKQYRNDKWILPWQALLDILPGAFGTEGTEHLGYVDLSARSGSVTAIRPMFEDHVAGQSMWETSFAARIAEQSYHKTSRIDRGDWILPGVSRVPLRDDGSMLIDYQSHSGADDSEPLAKQSPPFETISMYDVAQLPSVPDPRFRNKIVLIGTAFTGDPDMHYIPIARAGNRLRLAHGVEIHANILRNLISGGGLWEPRYLQIWALSVFASVVAVALFFWLSWLKAALALIGAALAWVAASFAAFSFAHFALPIALPLYGLICSGALMGGYLALSEERQRRRVLGMWGQYQDPRLVNFLLENETARGGQGQEMEVTVLFADLKNFTKTVEHLTPTDAISALNRYLGMLDSVIRSHGGIVDKYLGDGLMAQWGAPDLPGKPALEGHALAAVHACLDIQKEAARIIVDQSGASDFVSFELRLTLHTGPVVFGWVGAKRLELTIIGDTVNVTSRLQETAKALHCDFLISESTFEQVKEAVVTGQCDEVEIRGRTRPLLVYEVLGEEQQVVTLDKI